jgi:hypothetical protein
MSALGQKQTLGQVRAMSALPPKAGIRCQAFDVCFVPIADSRSKTRNRATKASFNIEHRNPPPLRFAGVDFEYSLNHTVKSLGLSVDSSDDHNSLLFGH